jgi:hypothetical protein
MRFAKMVVMTVAMASLPALLPAAVGAQTVPPAAGAHTVTVSSSPLVAYRGPSLDVPSGTLYCGIDVGPSCAEVLEAHPKYPVRPAPASQQAWGRAQTSDNTCRFDDTDTPDCTAPGPNGWGVDPIAPTEIELGSVFPIAETWHRNAFTQGDQPSGIGITGALRVAPRGRPAFDFPLGELPHAEQPSLRSVIRISNLESGSNGPQFCESWQRTDIPCDDLRLIETKTYSHVEGGLTWRLQVLGFIDPGGSGEPSAGLIVPEPDWLGSPSCLHGIAECVYAMNNNVQPLIAPVVARLTVDTATSTAVASSANPSTIGQPVTFTATVTASDGSPSGTPSGTVVFSADGTTLSAQPLGTGGQATYITSTLSVGTHAIQAAYSGDASFAVSSGSLIQTVTNSADLSVSLGDAPDPVALGDVYAYGLKVTNNGPGTGTQTSASLKLSGPSHTVLSASASQGSCSIGASVGCSLGTIAPGGSAMVTVKVEPNGAGTMAATATAAATEADPNTADNTAAETTTVSNAHGCTITGTPGNDTISGTNGADVICALGGDDTINGGNDTDVVYAGSGNDRTHGEGLLGIFDNGSDTMYGGPGNDDLDGQNGNDTLIDTEGTDTRWAGGGNDTIVTADGFGGDTADGGNGPDTCTTDTDPADTRISC